MPNETTKPLNEIIAENIRFAMAVQQITVKEIANKTGISRNAITTWRLGKFKMIQLNSIGKICQALSLTPADLFTEHALIEVNKMPNEDNYWLDRAEQFETRESDQEKEQEVDEYADYKEHEWEAEDER